MNSSSRILSFSSPALSSSPPPLPARQHAATVTQTTAAPPEVKPRSRTLVMPFTPPLDSTDSPTVISPRRSPTRRLAGTQINPHRTLRPASPPPPSGSSIDGWNRTTNSFENSPDTPVHEETNHRDDDNLHLPHKKEHDKSKFGVRDYFTSLMKSDKKGEKKDKNRLLMFYDTIFKDSENELGNTAETVS